MSPQAVKFALGSDTLLHILAIPFGGPEELGGRDLDNEFFSKSTDLCSSWFPVSRPLLYEHGLRPDTDVAPVGKVDSSTAVTDEVGVWVDAELDRQAEYYEHIRRLVEQRKMFASSGAMPHLVRRGKSGHIDRWPWVELSLTPVPANPLATVQPREVTKHYKAAGITPPPTLDDVAAVGDTRSYAESLDDLLDDLSEVAEATRRHADVTRRHAASRHKVGRSLSASRRKRLADFLDRMRDATSEIEGLLAETAPHPPASTESDEATAEANADPETVTTDAGKGATASAPAPAADGTAAPTTPERGAPLVAMPPGKDAPLKAIFEHFQRQEPFYKDVLALARTR